MQLFVSRAYARGQALVSVGDLNVAHTPADISHPAFFISQFVQPGNPGDSGQPGFTPNERRRFDDILREGTVPHDVFSMIVDCGTPSRHPITFCIRALAGQLVDTFRHFNPLPTYHPTNTTAQHPEHAVNPAAANYTWRGCEGKNNPMSAKYYKKVRVV